jgi:outer membrane protein OmpA-like peptidoglycan-associated protein
MKKYLLAGLATFAVGAAHAVNIQTFSFTQTPNYAIIEDALDPNSITNNNYKYLFTAAYHYVRNPLVVLNSQGKRTGVAIDYYNSINLGFGYRLNAESIIGLETFVSQAKYDNKTGTGLGDTSLTYKYRLTDKSSPFAIALIPKLFVPTGKEDLFLSDKSFGYGGLVAIEKNLQYLQLAINLGYISSADAKFSNLDYREKFVTGIGAYIPVNDKWGGDIEFCRQNTMPLNKGPTPSEFFTGIRVQANDSKIYYTGIGWGDLKDSYGNDFRIVAGIKWTPRFYEASATPEHHQREELVESKNIHFAHASSKLSKTAQGMLEKMASEILGRIQKVKIIHIEGYASPVGKAQFNLALSQKRAAITKDYLVESGVPLEKLEIVSTGDKSSPLDDYAANRRVEIRILEK